MSPLRLLVCDDHPLIRLAIREEVEGHGFVICAEAWDTENALAAALEQRADICLLDVGVLEDGIATAAEFVAALPEARIVLMTAQPSTADALAALAAGVSGYLVKDLDQDRLPHILLEVAAGEVAFPRTLMSPLAARYRGAAQPA